MRITHIINDTGAGGAQTLVEQLASRGAGHFDVDLLVLREPGSLSERLGKVVHSIRHFGMGRASNDLAGAVLWARAALRDIKPDVVQTHLLHADLVGLLASQGCPTVWTLHSTGYTRADPIRTRVLSKINARISKRVARVVACTSQARDYALREGYCPDNLEVIRNGIAASDAPGAVDRTGPPRFVSLSRWHPMKDHRTLFQALALVSDSVQCKLECYGREMTNTNDSLVDLLTELKSRRDVVRLMGHTDAVRTALSGACALVISSAYGEALPMAGLEALALGVPVVTTDVGDCSHLALRPWLCVAPRDARGLADACIRLAAMTSMERMEMALEAQELCRSTFGIDRAVAQYSRIYSEIADEASAGRGWRARSASGGPHRGDE